ncbi:MAG: hypothetical protein ACI4DQ_09475, partial [Lachnospiraceae bacterium]
MRPKQNDHIPHGRYITREEFAQYVIRGEEGHKRVNRRLESLENMEEKVYQIVSAIDKMSTNVEHMLKALEKQEKRIDEHDVMLDTIATKGSKKWDSIAEHIWKYIA